MNKKISTLLVASIIATNVSPAINVFADNVIKEKATQIEENVFSEAKISNFKLNTYSNYEGYNQEYKISRNEIVSISNNGGVYGNSVIANAIDGNTSTHWETGKSNSDSFKNEVVFEFDDIKSIDRIAYATRQDSAKGKGFPTQFEIYSSISGNDEDYTLVTTGAHPSTGNIMEFKFDTIDTKKLKFVFKEANQGWASASEFMFYKEDKFIDKLNNIFTNDSKNELNEDYNTIEKLENFENEMKTYPLYEEVKNDINDAKLILQGNSMEYVDANVSKFKTFGSEDLIKYDETFKVSRGNISSITTNGSHYGSSNIEKAIDGDINTSWHSGKTNSDSHTNEVIITLDELMTIDRVMYTSLNSRGFAKEFDVYASKTLKGDTFEKISSGSSNITRDTLEIKFNPTELRRIKFVFKQGHENWALASEFGLYKQDEVKEKVARLFTDSTMSVVSEEFASLEKIEALENEAKNHAFYNDFKEDISNAKEILEQNKVESVSALTTKVSYGENLNYSNAFRMPYENIKKITANAGHYGSQNIEKAVDGSLDTYWETNKSNTNDWKNEVIVEFNEATTLDRIVYGARQSDTKGFLEGFEIYASQTTKGDTFNLVASGNAVRSKGLMEIKFEPTKFKRVKIKFVNSNQNWATLNELMFYTKDEVRDDVLNLFTDKTLEYLKPEYNSTEAINSLQEKLDTHPLKEELQQYIDIANDILNNELETIKTVVAEQHGNMEQHAQNTLKFGFGNNLQPTGVLAKPGDQLVVYVEAEAGKPLPKLFFSQQEGSWASWGNTIELSPGKNVITVPKISQEYHYGHKVTPGGPVYIVNPYTSEQQGDAPKIRFVSGGEEFPYLDENTNEEEFLTFLKEYKNKMDEDIKNNPDVMDRKVIDTFEFKSDHIFFTGTASAAYEAYIKKEVKPLDTIKSWNTHMEVLFKYYGLDGNNEYDDPKYIRENIRLAQPWGYMYAASGHIGVQGDVMTTFLIPFEDRKGSNWGLDHEIGHRMDVQKRLYGESTNNMLPLFMDFYSGVKPGNSVPYDKVYKNVMSEDSNVYVEGNYFERIAPFWQLELYKPGYWAEFNSLYRERDKDIVIESGSKQEESKTKYIVQFSSEILNMDLSEYFDRHGFPVTDELKAEMSSKYQKSDKKLWYINDSLWGYKGEGFKENATPNVSLSRSNDKIKLDFDISSENKDDVLGYEILKNGEVVGFTNKASFTDEESNLQNNDVYSVIAYDKKLNTSNSVEIESHSPMLNVSQERLTLRLGEEFNTMDFVKASSYDGEDITSSVKIESNVDSSKKGNYAVKYIATSNDITKEVVMDVEVVSDYKYLSDTQWTSSKAQWGTPRRNQNIKGRLNGEIKTFEKGFGIHAKGEIVYDLGEHNYENFETLVGVDMGIQEQGNSSITFKITGDGETLATTKVLKHADNMAYINVPIKGIKELKIEVFDGGNGNTSDHGVIVNPKLTINNSKPTLNIPKDTAIKVGEILENIAGTFSASDIEDGDLTESVVVSGVDNVNFNKSGNYPITYSVADSDGNRIEKTRNISVVNMDDYNYLTDYNYKTAQQGWNSLKIDKAVSDNKLRLTNDENQEVVYDRGLGTHSTSTIVYDLSDKDYEFFTSYIGVDRAMYNTVGSVEFKVYVDGEEVYNSGIMRSKDAQKYVEVNIAGAKELKLVVTDGGNGNGSDHANWADAKLHFANGNRADFTLLEDKIKEIEAMDLSKYTEESISQLTEVVLSAKELMKNTSAQQEEIDSMINMLEEKVNLLEVTSKVEEYEKLKDLAEKIEGITKDMITGNHIDAKWSNLEYCKSEAKRILEDNNSTEEDFKNMTVMINYCLFELDFI